LRLFNKKTRENIAFGNYSANQHITNFAYHQATQISMLIWLSFGKKDHWVVEIH
jgi:hypothetical protein